MGRERVTNPLAYTTTARKMTPREIAISALGHGPQTVSMLAGLLLSHGIANLDCMRVAKEELAALVLSKRAEAGRWGNADVYRLSASTPVEANDEPKRK
jgi:hypothetical protein